MRTFDRGDIVWIDFEPSVGTEQKGTPGLGSFS